GDDLVAVRNRQVAARAEAVLDIDQQQGFHRWLLLQGPRSRLNTVWTRPDNPWQGTGPEKSEPGKWVKDRCRPNATALTCVSRPESVAAGVEKIQAGLVSPALAQAGNALRRATAPLQRGWCHR